MLGRTTDDPPVLGQLLAWEPQESDPRTQGSTPQVGCGCDTIGREVRGVSESKVYTVQTSSAGDSSCRDLETGFSHTKPGDLHGLYDSHNQMPIRRKWWHYTQ
jgi:hypothetical protein